MKNKTMVRFGLGCLAAMLLIIFLSTCSGQADILPKEYIVSYGDTIWSIAAENCPNMRTDKAVYLIRQWNGCGDCIIHAGEVLLIPAEAGEEDVL